MAKHKPAKMLAVLGRCRRTGRWRVGARSSILAVLGSCRLDMRSSFVEDDGDEMKMKVTVFLGSAVFILPDGAEVRPSGMSLLSAETVDVPEHPEPSGLPTLEIEWTCVLGRVQVVTGPAMERLEEAASLARAERRGKRGKRGKRGTTSAPSARSVEPLSVEPVTVEPVTVEPERVEPVTVEPGPEPEVATASDPAPLADAWRTHDWAAGPSDVADEPAAAVDEPEPELEPAIDDPAPADEPAPLSEAWRTHDWGDGPSGEVAAASPGATTPDVEAEAPVDTGTDTDTETDTDTDSGPAPLEEAWRNHDWGPGRPPDDDDDDDESDTAAEPAGTTV